MRDKTSLRFILLLMTILFIVPSPNYAGATRTGVNKTIFAFVVSCREESAETLCLVGKFKTGTKVTLLQSKTGNTCLAVVTARGKKIESSGTYLTEISGSCDVPEEYAIAVLEKPVKDYEKLLLKEITDADVVSRMSRSIMKSGALLTLLKKAQDSIPGDIKDLDGVTPRVYQVPVPGLNIFIVSYKDSSEHTVKGPHLVVINNRVYPLTGWCSYRTLHVFRLEGLYYIQSGSCCCGCGITIMELFRITPEGPVEVVSDWSLSN